MFRATLCPSSGAREYYTSGCCLSYLMLGFQVVGMVWCWGLCVWSAGCCATARRPCWASNKICNKNHLLHLVGVLFPHKTNIFVYIYYYFIHIFTIIQIYVYIAYLRQQWHNSKCVIFQENLLKVLKRYNFLWVQRRHNCSPAVSFANCVMTLYLLNVHLQTFLSIPTNKKWQILSCDTLVANEQYSRTNVSVRNKFKTEI